MKTAISIPNNVFDEAEKLARRLKISRSQLYSQAVKFYLEQAQAEDVTSKLNQVYENTPSNLDQDLTNAQIVALVNEEW